MLLRHKRSPRQPDAAHSTLCNPTYPPTPLTPLIPLPTHATPAPFFPPLFPFLQGRATLQMKVDCRETPEGPQKFVQTIVLDGYNAPVSAGQFLDLVLRGFYDGMEIQRADGFVVQTGDPDGPADGFVDPKTGEIRRWVAGAGGAPLFEGRGARKMQCARELEGRVRTAPVDAEFGVGG